MGAVADALLQQEGMWSEDDLGSSHGHIDLQPIRTEGLKVLGRLDLSSWCIWETTHSSWGDSRDPWGLGALLGHLGIEVTTCAEELCL